MKNLKELRAEWYRKLKESGFKDIEDYEGYLIHEGDPRSNKLKDWRDHQEYYSLACEYLNSGEFEAELDKQVWELFCEGNSIRKIERSTQIYRFKVHKILLKYQERAGIRKWKR